MVSDRPTDRSTDQPTERPTLLPIELLSQLKITTRLQNVGPMYKLPTYEIYLCKFQPIEDMYIMIITF